MLKSCAIINCKASSRGNYRFVSLPTEKRNNKRRKWMENCGDLLPSDQSSKPGCHLCERHFDDDQWKWKDGEEMLKKDAVPTIFIRRPPKRRRLKTPVVSGEETCASIISSLAGEDEGTIVEPGDLGGNKCIPPDVSGNRFAALTAKIEELERLNAALGRELTAAKRKLR